MATPAAEQAAGFARLAAAVAEALGAPRPITTYGCLPFVPGRVMGPKDRICPICRRPRRSPEPSPPDRSEGLICGGCDRGSVRVEYVCGEQRRRDEQHKHLVEHNRELTKDTPRPAILDAPPPEPDPAASAPRKGRKRAQTPKEAVPC